MLDASALLAEAMSRTYINSLASDYNVAWRVPHNSRLLTQRPPMHASKQTKKVQTPHLTRCSLSCRPLKRRPPQPDRIRNPISGRQDGHARLSRPSLLRPCVRMKVSIKARRVPVHLSTGSYAARRARLRRPPPPGRLGCEATSSSSPAAESPASPGTTQQHDARCPGTYSGQHRAACRQSWLHP